MRFVNGKNIDKVEEDQENNYSKKQANAIVNIISGGLLDKFKDLFLPCFTLSKQKKYNLFLEKLSQCDKLNIGKINKLGVEKCITDSEFDEYITSILDALFFTQSKRAIAVLSYITAKYLYIDDLDYVDMVLVLALKEFNDEDISIFLKLENMECHKTNVAEETQFVSISNYTEVEKISANKLISKQIFEDDVAMRIGGSQTIKFHKSIVSSRLAEYLKIVEDIAWN